MKNYFYPIVTLLVLFLAGISIASAQPFVPYVDSSFNTIGRVILDDTENFIPQNQTLLPDGKILVGGYGQDNAIEDLDAMLYLLNPDGTRDAGFGDNGFLRIDVDGTHDAVQGAHILPDGKILLLLVSNYRIVFIRLLPTGDFDQSYGNGGIVLATEGAGIYCNSMAVQADQKILVVGFEEVAPGIRRGFVRRYNPDGLPDTAYGNNGYVPVVLEAGKSLELQDCVLQSDGKLLATGPYGIDAGSGFPLIRLNTDGSFDNTFSTDGKYSKILGATGAIATAYCMAIQPDGKILVGGFSPGGGAQSAMTVISVKTDGTTNSTFGSFGTKKIVLTPASVINDLLVQPDGKILMAGYCIGVDTATALAYARLNPDGSIDNSFGPSLSGYFVATLNAGYKLLSVIKLGLQPDGRLLSSCWMNRTIFLDDYNPSACVVFRNLMDILVGTAEPDRALGNARVFPNLIGQGTITVEYTLSEQRVLSLSVFDGNGTRVASPLEKVQRPAGWNREEFELPQQLPAGVYFAVISTGEGMIAMKMVKQ